MQRFVRFLALCGVFVISVHAAWTEDRDDDRHSEVKPAAVGIQDRYQNVTNERINLGNLAQVGEKLVYRIKWNGLPAGTTILQVKRKTRIHDRIALVLEMRSVSNDFLSAFYHVDSRIKSFVDIENGASYLFRREIKEGNREIVSRQEFRYDRVDPEAGLEPATIYTTIQENGASTSKTPRPIPGLLQDPLSIVYYLRALDFTQDDIRHRILTGGEIATDVVSIRPTKFERISLGALGKYDTVVVEPQGEEGIEQNNLCIAEGPALVWLEKHTKIPLKISVRVPIGRATLTLVQAEKSALEGYKIGADGKAPIPLDATVGVEPIDPLQFDAPKRDTQP